MLRISRLAVENLTENITTDQREPVFSYQLDTDRHPNHLKEAVIRVREIGRNPEEMRGQGTADAGTADSRNDLLWEKRTNRQAGIRYRGEALQPLHAYEVTVTAEDRYGETAESSVIFETGKMGDPWTGAWITDAAYTFREKKISPVPMMFRKEILPEKPVKRARIFSTALGIYELTINGEKVGEDYFAPGFTSYHHQMQYQVYDVTGMLQGLEHGDGSPVPVLERENRPQVPVCLEAVVAGGWAVGSYTYFRRNRVYGNKQALLLDLELTYEDGSIDVIGTDESWQVAEDGKYREADIYDGEVYDASVDEDAVTWRSAALCDPGFTPNLQAEYGAPVRAHEELHPVSVTTAPSGEIIYDMGQNFAGVVKAKIHGRHGQTVTFRHAEILMDGELFTEPLRSAKARAEYTCVEGEQEYSPRLTYMGFRYIGVSGIAPEDIEVTALALYSDVPQAGAFSCSNEMLNRLQKAVTWGAKSNFVDIPTDCPQRDERLGWTGDIALFSPTACYNFDMSRFLEKWLLDVKAEQGRGGGIPTIIPQVKIFNQYEMTLIMAIDHWGDCCIWVPWAEYMARGDVQILRKMYPTMKKYLRACCKWAGTTPEKGAGKVWKLGHHYGDWCALDTGFQGWMRRGRWTATAALAYSAGLLSRIAEILGQESDAAMYRRLSENTAKAYREQLLSPDGRVKGFKEKQKKESGETFLQTEFPTAYVLPLYYGLLSGEAKKRTAAHLARMVRENDYHVTTGFPGTPYILFALMDNGYEEEAWRMLLTDTCPSWLYEIKVGGTTTWERWDALREDGTCNTGEGVGMVSFNHYAAGSVGNFLYRRVLGIEPEEGGYRQFVIAPKPGGGLTEASGYTECAYGRIAVSWKIAEDGTFALTAEVPVSTRCRVELPDGRTEIVGSGRHEFECRMG